MSFHFNEVMHMYEKIPDNGFITVNNQIKAIISIPWNLNTVCNILTLATNGLLFIPSHSHKGCLHGFWKLSKSFDCMIES